MANNKEKKVLIRIENLKKYFPIKSNKMFSKESLYVRANDDVSIDIYEGETFGLVGESGCGKSTLGRTLLQLYDQTDGRTIYYGRDIHDLAPKYVSDILKNLPAQYKKLEELRGREKSTLEAYEKLDEGQAKYEALERYREEEKQARAHFLDLAQLLGGLLLSDNMNEVSKVVLEEHRISGEIRSIRNKINAEIVQIDGTTAAMEEEGKSSDEIEKAVEGNKANVTSLETQLRAKEAEYHEASKAVESMKDQYRSNPDFERYEKYKDDGVNLARLTEKEIRGLRKDLQLIFQDPYSSLNPRLTVGQIISEGLQAHKMFAANDPSIQDYILKVMEDCGLAPYFIHRYPHQFSGGQRQRIGIARSVALKPKFIVCDEAVSALDVSIQSQIINLLLDLKEQEELTYLFISHDLSVIKYISDRVGVMYLGNIVELAATGELYERPMHPYTEALLSAIPSTDPDEDREVLILEGDIPSPINPPAGCKFHTRCKYATDICKNVEPIFEEARPGHFVACHHKLNVED